jgi:mannosyltransferase OCH1-like enzyme
MALPVTEIVLHDNHADFAHTRQAKPNRMVAQSRARPIGARCFKNDMRNFQGYGPMIPKLIHQTWRDTDIPEPKEWPESWKRINPGWTYRLWTDADLLALVQSHYPDLEQLFLSYPNPVQRADMGRYLILHHCGGVYADLDTECLSPLDPIADDTRVILSEEPIEHKYHIHHLGLERMYFNGVMASPKGHPFWDHLITMLVRCRHGMRFVLESTGPLVLTGAVESYARPAHLALQSCHLFAPLATTGRATASAVYGDYADLRICNHFWNGSWFKTPGRAPKYWLKKLYRKTRCRLTRGPYVTRAKLASQIHMSVLHRPIAPKADANIAVLIPVRDAEPFLDRCFDLLLALEYPKHRLKIVFCEGDSVDSTAEKLQALASTHQGRFRDIIILHCPTGGTLDRSHRWMPKLQYSRRANLAHVRNHLIDHGLAQDDDWALWVDADVCDYAAGILNRLLAEQVKVVTPDCVLDYGGPSYDQNAFNDNGDIKDHRYLKHVKRGLFMPPASYDRRRHLHNFRFLDRVPLSSVGGTMLLVRADVHRAGIRFPEIPYDDLLETEGFGRICRDFGVQPMGLPNVQIKHVQS